MPNWDLLSIISLKLNLKASAIREKCQILIGAHVNPGTKTTLKSTKEKLIRTVLLGIN